MARKYQWQPKRNHPYLALQWDRAFDGAEMLDAIVADAVLARLQWDRAFDGAEMSHYNGESFSGNIASMGPRL